jgi:hypothetical protein
MGRQDAHHPFPRIPCFAWDLQLRRHLYPKDSHSNAEMAAYQSVESTIGNVQLALLLVLASTSALDKGSMISVQTNTV